MDFKITKNDTIKLPLAKKYIKEDVNITVEVPIPEGYVKPEGELTITENGTYDVKDYESTEVTVPIPDGYIKPEGTIEIFEDGIYDITQYASANISRDSNEDVTEEVEEYTSLNTELEEVINSLPNVSDLEPVLQDKSVTPTTNTQNVTADDDYDGLGTVTVNPIPEEYVKPTSTKGATTYTPTTIDQTIASGTYLSGTQTIKGDTNLVADNIKSGVSIFGVNGTYEGSGGSVETCTVTAEEYVSASIYYVDPITGTLIKGEFFSYYDDAYKTYTVLKNSLICVTTSEWGYEWTVTNGEILTDISDDFMIIVYVTGDCTISS